MPRFPQKIQIDPNAPKVDKRSQTDADGWARNGVWVNVKSSNVAGIRYDLVNKRLFVEFKIKDVYQYDIVPSYVAKSMFNCSSMGRFVHYVLKKRAFPYKKYVIGRIKSGKRRRRFKRR